MKEACGGVFFLSRTHNSELETSRTDGTKGLHSAHGWLFSMGELQHTYMEAVAEVYNFFSWSLVGRGTNDPFSDGSLDLLFSLLPQHWELPCMLPDGDEERSFCTCM